MVVCGGLRCLRYFNVPSKMILYNIVCSCIQSRSIPNLVLELDIIDKIPWIMCA